MNDNSDDMKGFCDMIFPRVTSRKRADIFLSDIKELSVQDKTAVYTRMAEKQPAPENKEAVSYSLSCTEAHKATNRCNTQTL